MFNAHTVVSQHDTRKQLDNITPGQNQGSVLVDSFCYLICYSDCMINSSGGCGPDIHLRLGVAATVMSSLARIWSHTRLSVTIRLRLYQTSIVLILLDDAETWILLVADRRGGDLPYACNISTVTIYLCNISLNIHVRYLIYLYIYVIYLIYLYIYVIYL